MSVGHKLAQNEFHNLKLVFRNFVISRNSPQRCHRLPPRAVQDLELGKSIN